ncbi:MAG: AtpZ/AtpI family protein [Alphaproteobacteria bacterium]|nr:AtpZ/AtpI family protein [Alphaproteobacteria bacterium]
MSETPQDIHDLDERIVKAKNKHLSATNPSPQRVVFINVLQITLEMLSPLIVATCIGYLLDNLLNTLPIIMIVMIVFGVAAGVLNAYRAAVKIDKDMKED